MENKKEMINELDLDQMEKISGGSEAMKVCPVCGQVISVLQYVTHFAKCRTEQLEKIWKNRMNGGT